MKQAFSSLLTVLLLLNCLPLAIAVGGLYAGHKRPMDTAVLVPSQVFPVPLADISPGGTLTAASAAQCERDISEEAEQAAPNSTAILSSRTRISGYYGE